MDSGRYADGNCGGFAQTVPRSVLYASPLTSLDVYVPEKNTLENGEPNRTWPSAISVGIS